MVQLVGSEEGLLPTFGDDGLDDEPHEPEAFMRVAPSPGSAYDQLAEQNQPQSDETTSSETREQSWRDPALAGQRAEASAEATTEEAAAVDEEMSDEVWHDMQRVLSGKQLRPQAASLAHATGLSEDEAVAAAEVAPKSSP